jgi:hypothetical protein
MSTSVVQEQEFANSIEGVFARTLDSYQIAWRYKPRTFAIEWDEDGNFVDSFSPDFYLPEYDQYVELATRGVPFVEKTRRVLLLRRHHPEISIILILESQQDRFVDRLEQVAYRMNHKQGISDASHFLPSYREASWASA